MATAAASRRPHSIEYEGFRAMLSLAGVRMLSQSLVTGGGAASDNTYTVVNSNARRIIMFVNHATNVVRFNMNAAATASSMPVLNQRYFVIDAHGPLVDQPSKAAIAADVIHFFDTTGATPVHFMEVD